MDVQSEVQPMRMDSVATPRHDEPVLSSGGGGQTSPMMPPPAERLRDLRTPVYSAISSSSIQTKPSPISHSRSASMASASQRRGNRLSLSLPVQSPHYARHTPSSSISATPASSSASTPLEKGFPSPVDSNGFLVALAAQERRVLELKEELHRAEGELERLKRQWGLHEALKKRSESRHVEQLRSIPATPVGLGIKDEDNHTAAPQGRDEDMRKHARTSSKSARKVMTGQRHTRTLSLLDPSRHGTRQSLDRSLDQPSPITPGVSVMGNNPDDTSRSSTLPDLIKNPTSINEHQTESRHSLQGPPRDVILRTGRQMAEDFKDGLKTFFEDLRQATVGDEAVSIPNTTTPKVTKRQGSKSSLRSNGKRSPGTSAIRGNTSRSRSRDAHRQDSSMLVDTGGSFWKDHGIEDQIAEKSLRKKPTKNDHHVQSNGSQIVDEDGDAWDAWDTPTAKVPSPRWSSSTYVSEGSPPPETFNLAQNTSKEMLKQDEIPWPALQKLSPSNLKRTASTLMHEWEKSLTPPNEVAEEHSDYLSRSATPSKDGKIH